MGEGGRGGTSWRRWLFRRDLGCGSHAGEEAGSAVEGSLGAQAGGETEGEGRPAQAAVTGRALSAGETGSIGGIWPMTEPN